METFPDSVRLLMAIAPLAACIGLLAVVVLSCRYPGVAQFLKYGSIGVMATYVQTAVFFLLAVTCLPCLGPDDPAVKFLHFPSVELADGVRAVRFFIATAIGFFFANVFCWLMNRRFVFKPGKFQWKVEFAMFFGAATLATVIALGASSAMINWFGLETTCAMFIEVVVSFLVNFVARKFFIFKG